MGRKGYSEQRDLSKRQLDIQNRWINDQRSERKEARDKLIPEAEALMDSGYSEEERGAIMQSALESTGTGFDVARSRVERRRTRTRNIASYSDAVSELNRDEVRQKSSRRREVTAGFADEKQRRRLQGLQLLANLYGVDTRLLSSTAGLPLGALGQHSRGMEEGYWGDVIGGAAGAAGSWLGRPSGG